MPRPRGRRTISTARYGEAAEWTSGMFIEAVYRTVEGH